MDRFNHFGYAAYFIILELLHKDGVGDALAISPSRLCQKLRSRQTKVRELLDFCRTSGKVESDWKPNEVWIQINKFRERQSNLKSKLISKPSQPNFKTTLEEKREEKKRKETDIAPSARQVAPISKPKELTPQQRLIRYFKEAKGVNANDTEWDRKHWNGRLGKEANAVLKAFDGDVKKAGEYILVKGEEWKHLPDWGLNGIVGAAGRDPRLNGENDESQHSAMDAVGLDGPGRPRNFTSAREIAGNALAGLRQQAALSSREPWDLDGPGMDSPGDEPFEA
jgi:hypothetical protein